MNKELQKGDRTIDFYHKRNFTLHLVNNVVGTAADFAGSGFQSGTLPNKDPTETVTEAAWIMCAVSLRGQKRYKFSGKINGYCWDGKTTSWVINGHFERLTLFSCAIDFVGAPFVGGGESDKRDEQRAPIGFFNDEPVYAVKRVEGGSTIEYKVPHNGVPLPDSRTGFKLT